MYLGQGFGPDLYALPKDTIQEAKAYEDRKKVLTRITSECNPLDRRSTGIPQFHSNDIIHSEYKNLLAGQKT